MDTPAALAYVFDPEAKPFHLEKTVWGIPVVFRVLPGRERTAADVLADAIPSPMGSARYRAVGVVARALVEVDGAAVPGGAAPDDAETARRVAWIDLQPDPFITALADAYDAVAKEFTDLMSQESVPNS